MIRRFAAIDDRYDVANAGEVHEQQFTLSAKCLWHKSNYRRPYIWIWCGRSINLPESPTPDAISYGPFPGKLDGMTRHGIGLYAASTVIS